ncbi:DedA family protein [Candidatus Azambacteria bacterium]|nr:DedA family protein [Candidatus Azambacteria bacterium]
MEFLNSSLSFISQLGPWVYGLIFWAAFLESMVFIGVVIPGASLIVLAGFLSSQGYLKIDLLILSTTLGAVLGDSLSYYLGTKGIHFFHNENKLLKAEHLDRGREFFDKYGSKSIFGARFIAPLRAIVPFVAGLSSMTQRKFLFWNILSGFIWSVFHLLLGYFLGNNLKTIEIWLNNFWYISGAIIGIFALIYGIRSFNKLFKY